MVPLRLKGKRVKLCATKTITCTQRPIKESGKEIFFTNGTI
jgi:hypothetical protein